MNTNEFINKIRNNNNNKINTKKSISTLIYWVLLIISSISFLFTTYLLGNYYIAYQSYLKSYEFVGSLFSSSDYTEDQISNILSGLEVKNNFTMLDMTNYKQNITIYSIIIMVSFIIASLSFYFIRKKKRK